MKTELCPWWLKKGSVKILALVLEIGKNSIRDKIWKWFESRHAKIDSVDVTTVTIAKR